MTPEQTDLSQELVAREEWPGFWPGMRITDGDRFGRLAAVFRKGWQAVDESDGLRVDFGGKVWPDLTDAATCGCLLAMLQEEGVSVSLVMSDDESVKRGLFQVEVLVSRFTGEYWETAFETEAPTNGQALARALLAVWGAE